MTNDVNSKSKLLTEDIGCFYQLMAPFFAIFGMRQSNNETVEQPTKEEIASLLEDSDSENESEEEEEIQKTIFDNTNEIVLNDESVSIDHILYGTLENSNTLSNEEQQIYRKFRETSFRGIDEPKSNINVTKNINNNNTNSHPLNNNSTNNNVTTIVVPITEEKEDKLEEIQPKKIENRPHHNFEDEFNSLVSNFENDSDSEQD
ncbi:hypothetical protein ABK040_001504 [Willaertia magna]